MRNIGALTYNNSIGFGGWVRSPEEGNGIEVGLYESGKKISSTIANRPREYHWKDGEPISKFVFFYSDLPIDLSHTHSLSLKCGKTELAKSPFETLVHTYPGDRNENSFFFLHIPKSAGTSVRVALREVFSQQVTLPNEAQMYRNSKRYFDCVQVQEMSKDRFASAKFLVGHLPAAAIDLMPENCKGITFLREPISRAISNLMFSYERNPDMAKKPLFDAMHEMRNSLFNLQTRYFADRSIQDRPYFNDWQLLDEQGLQLAKDRLSSFHTVGLTEHLSESMAGLSNEFNFGIPKVSRVNVTTKDNNNLLTSEILETIKEWNQVDLQFYEYAVDLFELRRNNRR